MLMIKIVYCIILYYRPLCKSHEHRKRSHLQGVQKWHQEVPIFWSPLVGFADKNLQQSRIANPVWSCWMWPMMRMCYMTISCFTLCNLYVLVPLIVALHSTLSLSLSLSRSLSQSVPQEQLPLSCTTHGTWMTSVTFEVLLPSLSPLKTNMESENGDCEKESSPLGHPF